MASALCGALSSPSAVNAAVTAVTATARIPIPHGTLIAKPRPYSPRAAALVSAPPRASRAREPRAVPEAIEAEFEPIPEPVDALIAASEASETLKGEEVFAVVMIGSRQYIVFPGRFLYTQRLKGANVNDKIILNKVLLVGTKTKAYIGQPIVTNAAVHAVVEEQGLNRKVVVFKYKRKKNYRRNIGHRQPNTRIRITGISGFEDFPADTMESIPTA